MTFICDLRKAQLIPIDLFLSSGYESDLTLIPQKKKTNEQVVVVTSVKEKILADDIQYQQQSCLKMGHNSQGCSASQCQVILLT